MATSIPVLQTDIFRDTLYFYLKDKMKDNLLVDSRPKGETHMFSFKSSATEQKVYLSIGGLDEKRSNVHIFGEILFIFVYSQERGVCRLFFYLLQQGHLMKLLCRYLNVLK